MYCTRETAPTHHFIDVLLDQLHSPGLCDHPPGLLRVDPHTLSHIVPEGDGEIVKLPLRMNKGFHHHQMYSNSPQKDKHHRVIYTESLYCGHTYNINIILAPNNP